MIYEEIEAAIVAHLAPKVPAGVEVVKLPETEQEMLRPFENGRITVCYKRSTYGDGGDNRTRSTDLLVQAETLTIEVVIQSRWLRQAEKGVYDLWDIARRALQGFKPADCNRMMVREFDFVERGEGIFTFAADFSAERLAVQDYDTSTGDGALITQIKTNDLLTDETHTTP